MDRRVIVSVGALAAVALVICGAAIYSMRTGGVAPGWSHTLPNGVTAWTGYRVPTPPHREHPLAAVLVWVCAAPVAVLTIRFRATSA